MTLLSFINQTKKVPYENFETNNGDHSLPENGLPKKPHLRKATDQFFLVLFIASIILLMPFLAYTLYNADINRPDNYDKCGNICGQKNIKLLPWRCSGQDRTDRPYLNEHDKQCQSKPDYWREQTVPVNVWVVAGNFALISLFPLGLCLCLMLFFEYATAVVVWTILLLFLLFLAGLTIFAWGYFAYALDFVVIKVIISVLLLLFFCGLIIMRSKIHLVTMLFRKGTRAVLKHKEIFLLSAVTLLLLCIILVLCITTTVYMNSAANIIIPAYSDRAYYRPNNIMVASIFLNLAVTLWVMEVIIGIYYMTVSGIVAEWYFNRNKSNFKASVSDILCATLKYHLGTIALGSLIIILFAIPRLIFKVLEQFLIMNKIMDYCMRYIKVFLTKNSYAVTAIHGTPFCQSCRKTINLLMVNVGDTTAVNFYGDLVISTCQFLVVGLFFLTNMFAFSDDIFAYGYVSLIYVFGISIILCSIILGTVEAAFNSMLLCVCQESLDNNVPNQPNAISMMETLKQSLEKGNPPKISEEVEKPKENV